MAQAIVGPNNIYLKSYGNINKKSINFIGLGEYHREFNTGFFGIGSEILQANDMRKIPVDELLLAIGKKAKENKKCVDIYLEKQRLDNKDETYIKIEDKSNMLKQLKYKLHNCILKPKKENSQRIKQECFLGCENIRVHSVDLRQYLYSNSTLQNKLEKYDEIKKYLNEFQDWLLGSNIGNTEEDEKNMLNTYIINNEIMTSEEAKRWHYNFKKTLELIHKREKKFNNQEYIQEIKNIIKKIHVEYITQIHEKGGIKKYDIFFIQIDYYFILRMVAPFNYNERSYRCNKELSGSIDPRYIIYISGDYHTFYVSIVLNILSGSIKDHIDDYIKNEVEKLVDTIVNKKENRKEVKLTEIKKDNDTEYNNVGELVDKFLDIPVTEEKTSSSNPVIEI